MLVRPINKLLPSYILDVQKYTFTIYLADGTLAKKFDLDLRSRNTNMLDLGIYYNQHHIHDQDVMWRLVHKVATDHTI
jgi:hypothetical protein